MLSRKANWIAMAVTGTTIFICFAHSIAAEIDKTLWIWKLTPQPELEQDGFVFFCDAVKEFADDRQLSDKVVADTLTASNSITWSGHPDFKSFVPLGHEKYSESLVNGSAKADYSSIIELTKALCESGNVAASSGKRDEAIEIANAMLRLGYQLSRNKEDNIIGVVRVDLWKCAAALMRQTDEIDETEYARIIKRLNDDFDTIRKRDPDHLYNLRN